MQGTELLYSLNTHSGVFSRTLLNSIGPVDRVFLWIIVGSIAAAVAFYFLIPLFRKKQYKEARDNLQKREAAFKAATGRVHLDQEADAKPERKTESGNGPDQAE